MRRILSAPLLVGGVLSSGFALFSDVTTGYANGFGLHQTLVLIAGLLAIGLALKGSAVVIGRFYLLCFSVAIVVVAVELLARVVFTLPKGDVQWAAGWPNSELRLISAPDRFEAMHRYNALGFRGPEISPEPVTDIRVVCLGDSFTEGIGAADDTTWPAVLNRELAPLGAEVINLGDAGAYPQRYIELFAKVGVPLQATHAIICVNPPDFDNRIDIPNDLKPADSLPDPWHEYGTGFGRWIARSFAGWSYIWARASGRKMERKGLFWRAVGDEAETLMIEDLVRRRNVSADDARATVRRKLADISPRCLQGSRVGEYNFFPIVRYVCRDQRWSFLCTVRDLGLDEDGRRQNVHDWVRWFGRQARAQGIEPIIVLFPTSGLVVDEPSGPMLDEVPVSRPSLLTDAAVSDLLRSICDEAGVTYLDCTPVLRRHVQGEPLFLRYDMHPTERAYEIVGREIAAHLQQRLTADR